MTMQKQSRIPLALKNDTIIESLFEIRIRSAVRDVGDLLPGMLYRALRKDYPKLTRLPTAELPRILRQQQPNLMYTPLHRLEGQGRQVSVGDLR